MNHGPKDLAFSLTDQNGVAVTELDLRGTYSIVFFGFTNCELVCPRALERLTTALDELGQLAHRFRPTYVTVDPERDSSAAMKKYLDARAPDFLGLTGDAAELARLAGACQVFARRVEDDSAPDGYRVPHTAITYVFDPDGRYIANLGDGLDASAVAARLRSLLAGEQLAVLPLGPGTNHDNHCAPDHMDHHLMS